MIRRQTDPRHTHLITQHDHALLSAQLARHLGNDSFSAPDQTTIDAISLHDAGWPLHDDHPTLNTDHLPRDVFESTPDIALPVWTASVDRARSHHPYAGLLVSLHTLALSVYSSNHFDLANPHTRFAVNQFQHQEHERQKTLRRQLGLRTDLPVTQGLTPPNTSSAEDLLRFHFRLLQAMDLLSLALCRTTVPSPTTQPLHPHPGSPPLQLSLTRPMPNHLTVHPWPFNQSRLELTTPARRLPPIRFDSRPSFHGAYAAATTDILSFTLVPSNEVGTSDKSAWTGPQA